MNALVDLCIIMDTKAEEDNYNNIIFLPYTNKKD